MGYLLIEVDDLRNRLKNCIQHENGENSLTEKLQGLVADADSKQQVIDAAADSLIEGLGLLEIAGVSVESVLLSWVQAKEKANPELSGAEAETSVAMVPSVSRLS